MKKYGITIKAVALLLTVLLLPVLPGTSAFSAFGTSAGATAAGEAANDSGKQNSASSSLGTAIASTSRTGNYKWVWTYCDSMATLKKTGFMNTTFNGSASGITGKYAMFLTAFNDTYFAHSPTDNDDNWYTSGKCSENEIPNDKSTFITKDRKSSILIERTSSLNNENAFSAKLFMFQNNEIQYDYTNGKITKSTQNTYALRNDGDTDWRIEKTKLGEDFSFYFSNAKGLPKNADFYGFSDVVKIFETDNTNYMWEIQSNGSLHESKSVDSKLKLFGLWIGHFENVFGIPKGNYYIPSGQTMTIDDEAALVSADAKLTIMKDAVLYVKGKLYVEGSIDNYGTIIVEDGGKIVIGHDETYGKIYNNGYYSDPNAPATDKKEQKNADGNFIIAKGGAVQLTSLNHFVYSERDYTMTFYYTYFYVFNSNFTCDGTFTYSNIVLDYGIINSTVRITRNGTIVVPEWYYSSSAQSIIDTFIAPNAQKSFTNKGKVYAGIYYLS